MTKTSMIKLVNKKLHYKLFYFEAKNPYYSKAASMKLYLIAQVNMFRTRYLRIQKILKY